MLTPGSDFGSWHLAQAAEAAGVACITLWVQTVP